MSQAPHVIRGARSGLRLGQKTEVEDLLFVSLMDSYCGLLMAQTAEGLARKMNITREDQDAYALRSIHLGEKCTNNGVFGEEIVAVETKKGVVEFDDHYFIGATAEGLAALRPAFGKDGFVTAGNASGMVDGAACLVIADADAAERDGHKPLAEVIGWNVVGVDPKEMGIGPSPAIKGLLEKAKLSLDQIDLVEVNEAFSGQYLAVEKDLGLDREKTNVCGGAIALGHPLGATGARLLLTLTRELQKRGGEYGIASACIGGGQGIAMLIRNCG